MRIAELDRLADAEGAGIGRLLAGDYAEERRVAGAVRADDADDAAGRQAEIEVLHEQPVAIALADALRLDHEIAEARPRRQHDLRRVGRLLLALGDQRFVGGDARLRLRLTGARALADPFQLARQGGLTRHLLLSL